MNIEQMKTVLREILVATDLTPCVVGHRGVGKTAGRVNPKLFVLQNLTGDLR